MFTKEIPQGQVIFENGQKLDVLYLIMKGTVEVKYSGGSYVLHSGDVVGLCEMCFAETYMEYKTSEKTSVIAYPVKEGIVDQLFENGGSALRYFRSSAFRQFNEILGQYKLLKVECVSLYDYVVSCYEDYVKLCETYQISPGEPADYEEMGQLSLEEDAPAWIGGYYSTLEQMLTVWDSNQTDHDFVQGFLIRAGRDIYDLVMSCSQMREYRKDVCKLLMNENGLDLLELFVALYGRAAKRDGLEDERVLALRRNVNDMLMQLEGQDTGDNALYIKRKLLILKQFQEIEKQCAQPDGEEAAADAVNGELKGSLEKILAYAKCDGELATSFREHIEGYKGIINKNGTEEEIRLLRQHITKEFYQIYIDAFQNSIGDPQVPAFVKMLFQFGYVDEELAGMKNAALMYRIVEELPTAPKEGVYSYYEWLMAVYKGEKEPSRNEFDLDYTGYLHEEKKMGRITQEEEGALLSDQLAKVQYELQNVFPMVNKVTFGRLSTFCPVFSEHNVMKELESTLVTKDKVKQILENIRKKDYGAYYRETLFSKPEQGVTKEFINIEVLPDVILTPNVGTRGVMWQEIEGKRRNTPARMLSSIFQMEDLALILIRLTGEFRWEMCKRIQGARWNDMSERSLTSEYFDYIQFYRKNQDLSPDAKDKIKADMGRAKNSFKEMFVMDYLVWILYESNGAPRMNKVARGILFNYCTFPLAVREKLKANPMYREMIERYDVRMGQKRHRMDNLCQKLTVLGKGVPEEIEREKQFLYM